MSIPPLPWSITVIGTICEETVDVGVSLVAERTGITMQEPRGLERRDLGVQRGDVVDEAVGLVDQARNLRVGGRAEKVDARPDIGDGLSKLLPLLNGHCRLEVHLGLVEQVLKAFIRSPSCVDRSPLLKVCSSIRAADTGNCRAGSRSVAVGGVDALLEKLSICCLTPTACTPGADEQPYCCTGYDGASNRLSRM